MQYIQVTNETLILKTSKGSQQLSPRSFNYNKLKRLLEEGAEEEEVLPLLEPVDLPDGVFEAFLVPATNEFYYIHMVDSETEGCVSKTYWTSRNPEGVNAKDKRLLGVYTSLGDLKMDWPEYFV